MIFSTKVNKTSKGEFESFSYLNVTEIIQKKFQTCTKPEKVPEYFIASIASLKTVFVEGIGVTTNNAHKVMHECVMKTLNLEVSGNLI